MDALLLVVGVAGIHLLAVMSPGPNFLIISKNALAYSRQTGLLTAAGVATGAVIQITLGFLGVAAIVAQVAWLFNALKLLGALYLIYLGLKAFTAKHSLPDLEYQTDPSQIISRGRAYRIGLLTNLSNIKSVLYYLALFTTFISPTIPLSVKVSMAVSMTLVASSWYVLLAVMFSYERVVRIYLRFGRWIEYAFGSLMIGLGLRIAFARK